MEELLAEARRLAGSGEHERAVGLCREAVASGRRAEGYAAMASAYEAGGMHAKAAECLQKGGGGPSLEGGSLWYRAGRYAKAASEAAKVLKEEPGRAGALALKARALASQDRHAEALECCSGSQDPLVLSARGRALYETGRTKEAARCCKEACSAPGFSARFYAALSLGGREAKKYYEAALGEPRDLDASGASVGLALWRSGRAAEALEELRAGADPKAACIGGQILKEAEEPGAADWFKRAAKCRAANSEEMHYVGLACHMLGLDGDARWHQKAAKALKAAQARNRARPGLAQLLEAVEEERRRRLREAEEGLRAPERRAERKPERRARAAPKKKKKPAPAPPARADPAEAVARASKLCAPGGWERALSELDGLPVPDQLRPDAQFCKGAAYYGLAKYEEAQACFERAGSGPGATYWSAMSLFRLGLSGMLEVGRTQKAQRYRDAGRLLARILRADPARPGARTLAGLVEHHSSRSIGTASGADAERSFAEALKIDPADAVALYHLGQARERAGEPGEAGRMYERAAESGGGSAALESWPAYCKGYALDLLGQHETALSVYLGALEHDPDYGPGFAGQMREARGRPPEPHYNMQPHEDGRLDVCVVDTNVALPHLVRSFLPDEVREWMNLAYHRKRFWGRLKAGTYMIPAVCRHEIMGQLRSDFLAKYAPRAGRLRVIDGVKKTLYELPRTRWSEEAGDAGPGDVMRIRRAYWRAWFGMGREAKERWAQKKRRGNRQLAGGPPMGARDTRILAIAAKIAAGGSSVGLLTDDNDFLMFGSAIKELGVQVVEV